MCPAAGAAKKTQNMKTEITSHAEALTGALVLAIVARTENQFNQAVALAEDFASFLSPEEIEVAKAEAVVQAADWAD